MKELVVISGKGGTGKTSLTAAFAALAQNAALADCDVDAADLHLLLQPRVKHRETFIGGQQAHIDTDACTGCALCAELCRFDALQPNAPAPADPAPPAPAPAHPPRSPQKSYSSYTSYMSYSYSSPPSPHTNLTTYHVDPLACEGCGVCARYCPADAITLTPAEGGDWFISDTRHGPLVHARLKPAGQNSGRLVTLVRQHARRIAQRDALDLILVDGAPGIGCPVVASITGADLVLIVTEPTLSGLHDLERVHALTAHFHIPALICINKSDINENITRQIERRTTELGAKPIGTVPYDPTFVRAQLDGLSIVEYDTCEVTGQVRTLWERVQHALAEHNPRQP